MMKSKLIVLLACMLMLVAFTSVYAAGDGSYSGATGTDQGKYDSTDQGTTGSDQGTYDSQDQGTIGTEDQGTTEGRDQGTLDAQERDSDILKEDGDSQFQDSDIDTDNGSMDRLSLGSKDKGMGKDGMTGKDAGTMETEQTLRKAGISEEKIHQWQGIYNTPIYTNSPGFLLGLKDVLALTPDQQQKLTTLNDQNRSQAQQILTKEQRDKLAKLPTQQFTLCDLHKEFCRKMKTSIRSQQDKGCDLNCPMCPSQSKNGTGFQSSEIGKESGSMNKANGATDYKGSSWSRNGATGKDAQMMKDIEQKLLNAGVSQEKIHQWQGIFNTPIYTNSPGFILGLKDMLALTPDQEQKLTTLNEQTRSQAQQILTKEQQDKLAKLPTQKFTLRDVHQEVCRKLQSHVQQKSAQGQSCPMNCPLCPSQPQQNGSSIRQHKDGSTDMSDQPTTQPYQGQQ